MDSPSLVEDCARPARRLFAAIMAQALTDLRRRDALDARRALQWVAKADADFVAICLAAGICPIRFRRAVLKAFWNRVTRLDAKHRASLRPRGRPRGRPRKDSTKGIPNDRPQT